MNQAIVGWTGGTQFERDIRIKAKQRGLVFDSSGIYREADKVEVFARDEQRTASRLRNFH